MKKCLNRKWTALTLAVALVSFFGVMNPSLAVETVKKLHTAAQLVVNRPTPTQLGLSAGTAGSTTTQVIDLSGGALNKLNYMVYAASAAGTGTLTLTTYVSPDGGTTWIPKDIQTSLANGLSGMTSHYSLIDVGGGNKAKIVPTVTTGATWYNFKIWAMPRVD